jgi:hypothetical protein
MFGLALRSYQKKIRRLTESASAPDETLWQAVLEHVGEKGRARRSDVLARFAADGEREVGAVLNDLVGSGLVYQTGHGAEALYGITSEADLRFLARADEATSATAAVWTAVHRRPGVTTSEIALQLSLDGAVVEGAVGTLVAEGKLARDGDGSDARVHAVDLFVPVGAELGWEVAVFDHFRAVVNAIASKVRGRDARSASGDIAGGATLSFDVGPGHPFEQRVERLLSDVRAQVGALWNDVEAYNAGHALRAGDPEASRRVYFYLGQYVEDRAPDSDDEGDA